MNGGNRVFRRGSQYYCLYSALDLPLGNRSYLCNNISIGAKRWIFKAQAELIDLKYKPWLVDNKPAMLSLQFPIKQNCFPFCFEIPDFGKYWKIWLFKKELTKFVFNTYMNGQDWQKLGAQLKETWEFRCHLIKEFIF